MTQRFKIRSLAWRSILIVLALVATMSAAPAQESPASEHGRKVVHRVLPPYPELARQMRISGTVRLIAVVAPNGTVKVVETVGGHPVLVKSSEDAVMRWKYAPAGEETREPIEFHFSAPE